MSARLANLAKNREPDYQLADISWLPVIPEPAKILCIGTNYHDHRTETGREVPGYAVVFSRFANSQAGHEQAIIRPKHSEHLGYEEEMAVVIGRRGRDISAEEAGGMSRAMLPTMMAAFAIGSAIRTSGC
ncbi:MAG: fumarylacetoacetate hydrolase family protein [Pigmentiphaga sp.]